MNKNGSGFSAILLSTKMWRHTLFTCTLSIINYSHWLPPERDGHHVNAVDGTREDVLFRVEVVVEVVGDGVEVDVLTNGVRLNDGVVGQETGSCVWQAFLVFCILLNFELVHVDRVS